MVAYSLLEEYCKITTLLSVVEYVSTAIAAVGKCVLMNAYEKCLLNRVDEGDTVFRSDTFFSLRELAFGL